MPVWLNHAKSWQLIQWTDPGQMSLVQVRAAFPSVHSIISTPLRCSLGWSHRTAFTLNYNFQLPPACLHSKHPFSRDAQQNLYPGLLLCGILAPRGTLYSWLKAFKKASLEFVLANRREPWQSGAQTWGSTAWHSPDPWLYTELLEMPQVTENECSNDSVGTFHQSWSLGFKPQKQHCGRKKPTPVNLCRLTAWLLYAHTPAHGKWVIHI